MKSLLNFFVLVAVAQMLLSSGCSPNKFPVKPAKGKVIAGGQPVTYGSVTFTPVANPGDFEAGKPASGAIGPDGTFVLSTFNRFDGAIVGKHSVRYNGPEDEESEEDGPTEDDDASAATTQVVNQNRSAKKQPVRRYIQKEETIVEVTASGPNDFTIELQPAGK